VRELGVLPAYRGRGIASALLCDVLAGYRQRGRAWAGLAVDVNNTTGARRLYERLGLRTDEVRFAYERRLLPPP
jgi:ribosomal protein S18 acetylase RimI-like enzyme